jgi:hypothetical protein
MSRLRCGLAALGVGAIIIMALIVWRGVLSPEHLRLRISGMKVLEAAPSSIASRTFRSPSILLHALSDSRLVAFAQKSACIMDFEVVQESGSITKWQGELFCVKCGEGDRVLPLDEIQTDHLFQYWAVVPLTTERMEIWRRVMDCGVKEVVISVRCSTLWNLARSNAVTLTPQQVKEMIDG